MCSRASSSLRPRGLARFEIQFFVKATAWPSQDRRTPRGAPRFRAEFSMADLDVPEFLADLSTSAFSGGLLVTLQARPNKRVDTHIDDAIDLFRCRKVVNPLADTDIEHA